THAAGTPLRKQFAAPFFRQGEVHVIDGDKVVACTTEFPEFQFHNRLHIVSLRTSNCCRNSRANPLGTAPRQLFRSLLIRDMKPLKFSQRSSDSVNSTSKFRRTLMEAK